MQGKKLYIIIAFLIAFFSCNSQDTLSAISFYGRNDVYKKKITKTFCNINRHYRLGIKHGLFYIYDLSMTNNCMTSENESVYIINNHIYHIVSPGVYSKVSILMIPINGDLIFFEGVNCCKPIHDLEDVLSWISSHFSNMNHDILNNIMNYKNFHPDIPIDPQGSIPKCELPCKAKDKIHRRSTHKPPKIVHIMK